MMKKIFLMPLLALFSLSVWAANDVSAADTLVVTTDPRMHCASCENKIKQNIRFVKGTKKIETSIPAQTVVIVYDMSKSSLEDYAKAFKIIGYDIKFVPAGEGK